jgi:DNA polymerase-3 subunit epsilon
MGRRLIDDLSTIIPVVIDFEYTTPTGARPEPIEVAVQAVKIREGSLERIASWEALMRPPQHAEPTTFDTNQTGITLEMLADRPPAAEVLAELDRQFTAGPYLLIAHNAPAEARILHTFREHCPHLARIDLLDTVRLAKNLYPDLPRHTLDELLAHLKIPTPRHRHRAMPDVQATVDVLAHLIHDGTN